jgi:SAM-dependent methyltransferase
MMLFIKILVLSQFILALEKIFNNPNNNNPIKDTLRVLKKTKLTFNCLSQLLNFEKNKKDLTFEKKIVLLHKSLWQHVWPNYNNLSDYNNLSEYRGARLDYNGIKKEFYKKTVLDLGCGNGSVSIALLKRGAKHCHGVDFGKKNILTARHFAKILNLTKKTKFTYADIVNFKPKNKYDFIVCSAVLHHLKNKKDILRTLKNITLGCKPGTYFYFFIRGFSGIKNLAQDLCRKSLVNASTSYIHLVLETMGFSINKITHLVDCHKAVYLQTKPDEIVSILKNLNFTDFRRLKGPHKLDSDINQVNNHKHGKVKFGSGELRFICRYA